MEKMNGGTLQQLIEKNKNGMDEETTAQIMKDIL
jgi:hypothetical protein